MLCVGHDELGVVDLPVGDSECIKLKDLQLPLVSVKQFCHNGLLVLIFGNKVRRGRPVHGPS